jgi:hypothetical protein
MTGVIAVAAGVSHSLALTGSGAVWAWGLNSHNQLGDGTTTNRLMPIAVPGLTGVMAIAAGSNFSAALKSDGTVWLWGYGYDGAMGNGSFPNTQPVPTEVSGLSGVATIAAGGGHVLAVRSDGAASGALWAWGDGGQGYRFDGSTVSSSIPIKTFDGVSLAATSLTQSEIVRADPNGRSYLWGAGNHAYRLDYYTPVGSPAPTRLVWGSFFKLAPGRTLAVAIRRNLTLLNWGTQAGAEGFALGSGICGGCDPDGDGLTNDEEWAHGTDPWNADTNSDGLSDGFAVRAGLSATNPDMDSDGIPNAVELLNGTNPLNPDTDGDGVADGTDCFPLDPTRYLCLSPDPNDHTPPVITLAEPLNATLVSSVP